MTRGIFFRHVLREMAASTLAVGLVLLVVLATYQLAFVLGRAADGQVPGAMVPVLALLSLRTSLMVILPFALLLGIVLALGRLYQDNEITAAQSCGIPESLLVGAAGVVTVAAALLAAWVALIDAPAAVRRVVTLRTEAQRSAVVRQLVPGVFRSLGQGITLYFRAMEPDGSLQDVFLQRQLPDENAPTQLLLAHSARQRLAPGGDSLLVELSDGSSYEGVPGAADWRTTRFARQEMNIALPGGSLRGPQRVDGLSSSELLRSGQPRQMAEFHWRVAWVIDVILLGIIAVPLARLAPGQGRYARLPWAVLLFAIYAGLLTAGRTMLGRGELPLAAGLWWAHAAVAASGWWLWRARMRG
jgi:lipopolysaccharide export system permease protein